MLARLELQAAQLLHDGVTTLCTHAPGKARQPLKLTAPQGKRRESSLLFALHAATCLLGALPARLQRSSSQCRPALPARRTMSCDPSNDSMLCGWYSAASDGRVASASKAW